MTNKWKKIASQSFLLTFLSCGAIIVLLPLFWMILTAFKQSGQALEFKFLPSATVAGPKKFLAPLKKGEARVVFEYDKEKFPKLSTPAFVSVAGEFNGWNKEANILMKDGSVWVTTISGLKPGKYEYKFVLNGKIWTTDLSNPNKSDNGNSVIAVKVGHNSNKLLTDNTKIIGDKVVFQIYSKASKVKVEFGKSRKIIELKKDSKGFFSGEALLIKDEEPQYKVLMPQTFSEGLSKIYTTKNFLKVLNNKDFPFGYFFLNSMIVSVGTALLTVLFCTMAGYAFAKKDFFMKDKLFGGLLSTMMIPGMIFMVPQFAIVNKFGWINTYQGMIVPHLANIFGLFLLKQYISTIPNSLFEAATIDGASEFQIFRIIIIPLSLPVMVTLFLMTFVGQWGNFLWQLIVNTPDSPYRTLPVGLALFKGQYSQDWEMMMAGACFSIIPIAIIFLIAQRFFIEGMTSGAVKE